MSTPKEIDEIIVEIASFFPEWKPDNKAMAFKQYEASLAKYPLDLLRRAAGRCRDSCLYFPKPAEFHKAVAEILATDSKVLHPDAPKFEPPSPRVQAMLDDFRARMVRENGWKETRKTVRR